MPMFRYVGESREGRAVTGEIRADDEAAAREALARQGINVTQCELVDEPQPKKLSPAEGAEWSEQLAHVVAASRPLAAGLRAAAEESPNPRVAAALRHLAGQLESGKTLPEALENAATWIPQPLGGLIAAAARTGDLAAALADLIEHQRTVQGLRRGIWEGFAYPLVVTAVSGVLLLVLLFVASRPFEKLFREFALTLPLPTQLLFWWRDAGIWLVLGVAFGLAAAIWADRCWRGAAAWSHLMATVPVIGPLGRWLGLAECASLLHVLTRQEIPLPEALRLCASGLASASLRAMAGDWADGVASGQPLHRLFAGDDRVPSAAAVIVAWGENTGQMPAALRTLREMFLERAGDRIAVLRTIVPSILFVAIACCVLMIVGGLFMPLATLLNGLRF